MPEPTISRADFVYHASWEPFGDGQWISASEEDRAESLRAFDTLDTNDDGQIDRADTFGRAQAEAAKRLVRTANAARDGAGLADPNYARAAYRAVLDHIPKRGAGDAPRPHDPAGPREMAQRNFGLMLAKQGEHRRAVSSFDEAMEGMRWRWATNTVEYRELEAQRARSWGYVMWQYVDQNYGQRIDARAPLNDTEAREAYIGLRRFLTGYHKFRDWARGEGISRVDPSEVESMRRTAQRAWQRLQHPDLVRQDERYPGPKLGTRYGTPRYERGY